MAVILKFQSSGTMPGNANPVQMQGGSLTVGRGPSNDMVLPDPDRLLSKSHFVIEDHNGNVVIVDLSTNGTFLNYSKIPLGRISTPLNNGDVLSVGTYELVVEIGGGLPDLADQIAAPVAQDIASHGDAANAPDPLALLDDAGPGGDFLDDLLGGDEGPTGPSQMNPVDPIDDLLPPLGEEEDPFFQKSDDGREGEGASVAMHNSSGSDAFSPQAASSMSLIPDDWDDDDLLSPVSQPPASITSPPVTAPPIPNPQAIPTPGVPQAAEPTSPPITSPPVTSPPITSPPITSPPQPALNTQPPITPAAEGSTVPPGLESGDTAARAFLASVGVEDIAIADDDLVSTMSRMGRMMKVLITGLREILMTRTSIKSEFRIEQTMINAGGNNPLKFSISAEQAIEAMVRPTTRGYLNAETATEQALNDIKAHEIAMVTGMEAALKGVLVKLDPETLSGQIETKGGISGLLRGKKARYWEVYERLYAEIADQAENDFHELFSREFARAYKEQLSKLK